MAVMASDQDSTTTLTDVSVSDTMSDCTSTGSGRRLKRWRSSVMAPLISEEFVIRGKIIPTKQFDVGGEQVKFVGLKKPNTSRDNWLQQAFGWMEVPHGCHRSVLDDLSAALTIARGNRNALLWKGLRQPGDTVDVVVRGHVVKCLNMRVSGSLYVRADMCTMVWLANEWYNDIQAMVLLTAQNTQPTSSLSSRSDMRLHDGGGHDADTVMHVDQHDEECEDDHDEDGHGDDAFGGLAADDGNAHKEIVKSIDLLKEHTRELWWVKSRHAFKGKITDKFYGVSRKYLTQGCLHRYHDEMAAIKVDATAQEARHRDVLVIASMTSGDP
jgi:hypothetical protein